MTREKQNVDKQGPEGNMTCLFGGRATARRVIKYENEAHEHIGMWVQMGWTLHDKKH